MRSEIEIYRAHDVLTAIVLGEVPAKPKDSCSDKALKAALDALCWVLEHDKTDENNHAFGDNLRFIEQELAKQGHHLHRRNN